MIAHDRESRAGRAGVWGGVVLTLLIIGVEVAHARTYHVAQNDRRASDANAGTLDVHAISSPQPYTLAERRTSDLRASGFPCRVDVALPYKDRRQPRLRVPMRARGR